MERRSWLSEGTESHITNEGILCPNAHITAALSQAYAAPSSLSQAILETQSWPFLVEWTKLLTTWNKMSGFKCPSRSMKIIGR